MELGLRDERFIVSGAGSGFGKAITIQLLKEGAQVLAVSRTANKLDSLLREYPKQLEVIEADVTLATVTGQIASYAHANKIKGIVINAGGPPAKSALETNMNDWDQSYASLLRWKVQLARELVPVFESQHYGRILFIESASVKQPMENLVLSTAFRLAVVGFAKSLSAELASKGITVNVMAPGYHNTAAIERILVRQSETPGVSYEQAREEMRTGIPVQRLGEPGDFASLAVWLLSPLSNFVTGQTISVDGGGIKSIFG
jgi:3-oxoacyl-[acyl-carrier protein] reductase